MAPPTIGHNRSPTEGRRQAARSETTTETRTIWERMTTRQTAATRSLREKDQPASAPKA